MHHSLRQLTATVLLAIATTLQLQAAPGDTISLNEKWIFKLFRNEKATPKNFYSTKYNDSQWVLQAIPGLWRTPKGWGQSDYVGVYRGWTKLPTTFTGKRIMLHIGFTTTVADIYLNGEKIGTTAADRHYTEIDISALVHPGKRDLYVFRMNHLDGEDDLRHREGSAGITSDCYIYMLDAGQQPAQPVEMGKAKKGAKVGDRYNVRISDAIIDGPKYMQQDLDLLQKMGYNAVTYNKLSANPAFIDYARSKGWEVVSDAPESTDILVDKDGRYTPAAYRLLPTVSYDYKAELKQAESEIAKTKTKPKPKVKQTDVVTISDVNYKVVIDKQTGLLASYHLQSAPIFTATGSIRPNAKMSLQSLTASKPSKSSGTKVTAVFDIEGKGQEKWTYNIPVNGLMTITIEGESDILVTPMAAMSKITYLAQDFGPNQFLSTINYERSHIFWAMLANASGQGIKVMLGEPFTAYQAPKNTQLLMHHDSKKVELTIVPMK